jgi:hypothetical protein
MASNPPLLLVPLLGVEYSARRARQAFDSSVGGFVRAKRGPNGHRELLTVGFVPPEAPNEAVDESRRENQQDNFPRY